MARDLAASLFFGFAGVLLMVLVTRTARERRIHRSSQRQVGLRSAANSVTLLSMKRESKIVLLVTVSAALVGVVVIGATGAVAGVIPIIIYRSRARSVSQRRSDELSAELGPAIQLIIGHLRIGRNVAAAITEVAEAAPEPLASVLGEVVAETRVGASVDEALQRVAERENNRHLNVVASALGLQARYGGSLIEILQTVVETIEEEDRLRRDIKALTADGRLSAIVLLAMPPVMLLLVSLFSPGYAAPLIEEPLGRVMSVTGVVLALTGWRWLKVLGTPKVVA